ncbi:Phosphoadenosine phosphosulfate reductase like [uncultured Mediterranean phage uvMED]|nr:Phosphoadenosine phosphosulfate reductase like [uncultured Mediterranean phage uvMED]
MSEINKLRILSLGAGVQSSTLALMIENGELPLIDAAIFADVKGEPQKVYNWLEYLKTKITSYPIHIVTWRDLKQDILDAAKGEYKAFTAPFFTKNIETGKKGMLMRQCTADYKIKPVVQKVRNLLGLKKGEKRKKGTNVELLMGISLDEVVRMKVNPLKYITNEYPLVDKKMTRQDCLQWLEDNFYPTPPRSACTFCPYHSNKEWLNIKNGDPEEWKEVVEMDKAIRSQERFKEKNKGSGTLKDEIFLHRSCKPIDEVDFEETSPQLDLFYGFSNECEGMCGN